MHNIIATFVEEILSIRSLALLSVGAILALYWRHFLHDRAAAEKAPAPQPRRSVPAPQRRNSGRTVVPDVFLRRLHAANPNTINVRIDRWEPGRSDAHYPVYVLSFFVSAMSSKEELSLEFKDLPTNLPPEFASAAGILSRLLQKASWIGKGRPAPGELRRGIISKPVSIVLGEDRAA